MAGPKRPQDRVELPDVKKNFHAAFPGPEKTAVAQLNGEAPPSATARGDRGHHQLHQYVESVGDAGRGPAGQECRGSAV
jgi:aconitase A